MQVDLGDLTFCDVAGLRALHQLCVEQSQAGREVRIVHARPYFHKIARITGLTSTALTEQP